MQQKQKRKFSILTRALNPEKYLIFWKCLSDTLLMACSKGSWPVPCGANPRQSA